MYIDISTTTIIAFVHTCVYALPLLCTAHDLFHL